MNQCEYRCVDNHLLTDGNDVFAGRHVIFDVYGSPYCKDIKYVQQAMIEGVLEVGATIIDTNFHSFGDNYGFTGVIVLSESHASVHTWPEVQLMTFDIYMCGTCNPVKAMEVILSKLHHKRCEIVHLKRGVVSKLEP